MFSKSPLRITLPSASPILVAIRCPICESDFEINMTEESFEERMVRIWIGTGKCVCGRTVAATGYYGLRILRIYTINTMGRRSASVEFLRLAPIPTPGR